MVNKISFYDFDHTIMDTPLPEEGKRIWLEKTGNEYPHIGWWGRPESIDIDVFDIQPIEKILKTLFQDISDPETYTVMLTSRLEKLRPSIERILNKYNIKFDELSLMKGSDKGERIKEFLKRFPDVKTINIYDDREKEINIFRNLRNEIADQYLINIYKVTDGSFALVESKKILSIIKEEISNYKKTIGSLERSKNIPSEMKELISKYLNSSSKYVDGGKVLNLSIPKELKEKSPKVSGVSMGADKNGFFVYTHRARSKSFNKPESISIKSIEFINSTG